MLLVLIAVAILSFALIMIFRSLKEEDRTISSDDEMYIRNHVIMNLNND